LISFFNFISLSAMNRLCYSFFLYFLLPHASIHSQMDINRLEVALENASRNGQIIFLEEFTGLT